MSEKTYNCPVEVWFDESHKIRLIPIIIRGETTSTYQLVEHTDFEGYEEWYQKWKSKKPY